MNKKDIDVAELSDERVQALAEQVVPWLKAHFADLQAKARAEAAERYANTDAAALYADCFGMVCEDLRTSYEWLKAGAALDGFTEIADRSVRQLAPLLSTCTILCFPCHELSDLLTDREILAVALPIYGKKKLSAADHAELSKLERTDIYFLRDYTAESPHQNRIANLVCNIADEAAKCLKRLHDYEGAMMWLAIHELVVKRIKRTECCLSPAAAKGLMADLESAFCRLRCALRYEKL